MSNFLTLSPMGKGKGFLSRHAKFHCGQPCENARFSGSAPYRLGIRNANGEVYRVVDAESLEEAERLVKALLNLGFVEEDCPSGTDGCSSTFTLFPSDSAFAH